MSLWHVAFGPNDSWVRVTTDNISWSGGLPAKAYNLLNGRYINKGQSNSSIDAFDMDENDGYFATYKNGGWTHNLNPDVTTKQQISCVTLGPDGSYIILAEQTHWCGIPKRAAQLIRTRNNSSLKWAALGYEGSYFLSFSDGAYYWGGSMASTLVEVLENPKKSIKKLFLSASSQCFCLLFEDGSTEWDGNASTSFFNAMKGDEYMAPDEIAYLHSSIKSEFSCGRSIQETALSLENKEIDVEDIPCITVVKHKGVTWSLDNRRLWAFKKSGVERIPVIIGTANASFKQQLHNRFYHDIHIRGT